MTWLVLVSKEEIERMIELGRKWSEAHPRSFFGDDNQAEFDRFERVMKKVLERYDHYAEFPFALDALASQYWETLPDEEAIEVQDYIDWLRGIHDPPYEEEG